MDRQIVYPGSIPLDTDLLHLQVATMKSVGALAQATLGHGPVFTGLACRATTPISMSVQVGPGSLTTTAQVDATPFGSLDSDATPLVKMGVNLTSTEFPLTAPSAAGMSVIWLLEASFVELDGSPIVLPYYNAANPAVPFSGPNGSGGAQPTQRLQQVALQMVPGAAAPIGSAIAPPSTLGWTPLAQVTVISGTTAISQDMIAAIPTAPQLRYTLPQLRPGFSQALVLTASQAWTVPAGISLLKVRLIGGGGGGGGGGIGFGGGGGGAGGYAEGIYTVVPGTVCWIAVGSGGTGSAPGAMAWYGGTSSFGSWCSATGGGGGGSDLGNSAGGGGGMGYGGVLCIGGGSGQDGQAVGLTFAASGGASAFGGGARAAAGTSSITNALAPGAGGGGCYGVAGNGGNGADGLVIIEF